MDVIVGIIHFVVFMAILGYVLNLVYAYHENDEITVEDLGIAFGGWWRLLGELLSDIDHWWWKNGDSVKNITLFKKKDKNENDAKKAELKQAELLSKCKEFLQWKEDNDN